MSFYIISAVHLKSSWPPTLGIPTTTILPSLSKLTTLQPCVSSSPYSRSPRLLYLLRGWLLHLVLIHLIHLLNRVARSSSTVVCRMGTHARPSAYTQRQMSSSPYRKSFASSMFLSTCASRSVYSNNVQGRTSVDLQWRTAKPRDLGLPDIITLLAITPQIAIKKMVSMLFHSAGSLSWRRTLYVIC